MSRGLFSGKLRANVTIDFQEAFDSLSDSEQIQFIESNIGLIDNQTLLEECESRGILEQGGENE